MPSPPIRLFVGDCRSVLAGIGNSSIHLALTDPSYFLDRLDGGWNPAGIERSRTHPATRVVGGLPVGMKFDAAQGRNLQSFLAPVAAELLRVLQPGGFLLMFAAPRLHHRVAVAVEDAGFEIREAFAWRYTARAQFKAFSMAHFIRRRKDMPAAAKEEAMRLCDGRRTPQLRPQFEAISVRPEAA